jgi:hypothetical protein
MRRRNLTYIGVGLLLAALAGLEFFHELVSGDAPDAALCLTPESRQEAIQEILLHHLRGH